MKLVEKLKSLVDSTEVINKGVAVLFIAGVVCILLKMVSYSTLPWIIVILPVLLAVISLIILMLVPVEPEEIVQEVKKEELETEKPKRKTTKIVNKSNGEDNGTETKGKDEDCSNGVKKRSRRTASKATSE